jgi:hypothetical protein
VTRNPYFVHAGLSIIAFGVVLPVAACLLASTGALESSSGMPATSGEAAGRIRLVGNYRAAQPGAADPEDDEPLAVNAVRD